MSRPRLRLVILAPPPARWRRWALAYGVGLGVIALSLALGELVVLAAQWWMR